MGLPSIESYPPLLESDLPASRARWALDAGRAALLIHDLQEYFLDAYASNAAQVGAMLDNVARLKRDCAALGVPVVYSVQPEVQAPEQRGLLQDMWGPGITAKPERKQVHRDLAPKTGDEVLVKWRYSAFARTNFAQWLLERGRDQLLICGVYTHIGCQVTSCDAFMNDIQPFLVADATADFSAEAHRAAVHYVAGCCGVVLSCRQAQQALRRSPVGTADQSLWLREQVAELLGITGQSLDAEQNLLYMGMDSVRLLALTEQLRGRGLRVDFLQLAEEPTLSAWTRIVNAL